jgi:hypothetical protein
MNEPAHDTTDTYTVIVIRANGCHLTIESGMSKERAEALKVALQGFFSDVLVVKTQPSIKSPARPDPE